MLKIRSGLKAGGLLTVNHGLKVRSTLKAGGLSTLNHGLHLRRPR